MVEAWRGRVAVVDVLVEAEGAAGIDELAPPVLQVDEARHESFGGVELEAQLIRLERERVAVAEGRVPCIRGDERVAAEAAGRHVARHEREEVAGRPEALVLLRLDDVRLALAGLGVDDGQVDVGRDPAEGHEGADELGARVEPRVFRTTTAPSSARGPGETARASRSAPASSSRVARSCASRANASLRRHWSPPEAMRSSPSSQGWPRPMCARRKGPCSSYARSDLCRPLGLRLAERVGERVQRLRRTGPPPGRGG